MSYSQVSISVRGALLATLWLGAGAGLAAEPSIEPTAETSAEPTAEPTAEDVRLVALTPREERAVVRVGSEPLAAVGPGDVVPGTRAEVLAVLPDRLVLEEPERRREVWLFLPAGDGRPGKVQVLDFEVPPAADVEPGFIEAPAVVIDPAVAEGGSR